MAGISQIKISESVEFLKQLLHDQKSSDSFQKIQVLYLLKSEQVMSITEVAQMLGKHRVTVQGWLKTYQNKGIEGLLCQKNTDKGRKSLIPDELILKLTEKITKEASFKNYKEIQHWLQQELGKTINYDVVYYLVRKKLGISLTGKKPQNKLLNFLFFELVINDSSFKLGF